MNRDRFKVKNAMMLARSVSDDMSMTDPYAFRQLRGGATRMLLSGM